MTQEDKELLLKDLCARLPYGVKIVNIMSGHVLVLTSLLYATIAIENFRPYLRPMSSMTEEERKEYSLFFSYGIYDVDEYTVADEVPLIIDWLNKHYLDYRGLIPKGLVLEAPEGMYNINKK